uniref:CWF19-like protein 2 n=1 Tax=Cucumis melo TaxID=3656 RepID=A0A9I9D975_CUCME
MLSGVKIIARDKVIESNEKQKDRGKSTRYSSSDEEYHNTKKKKFERKKLESSKDYSTSSTDSEMIEDSRWDEKKHRSRRASKRNKNNSSSENDGRVKMKSRSDRNTLVGEYSSSSDSDKNSSDSREKRRKRSRRDDRKQGKKRKSQRLREDMFDGIRDTSKDDKEIVRKEMGLEWMLKPQEKMQKGLDECVDNQQEEEEALEEINKVNPRELNPYFKENGTGYPEDSDRLKSDIDKLPPPRVVGDGGASWRLKALKRAEEQAARDGRRLEEVVEERWGSLGQLAVSVAASKVAPSRSHLHAIRNRKRGLTSHQPSDGQNESDSGKSSARDHLKDISSRNPEMREPKVRDSLSWGKQKGQNVSSRDAGFISVAVSSLNKFSDDGSFASEFLRQQRENTKGDSIETKVKSELVVSTSEKHIEDCASAKDAMSANQLAAKAFQLQIKGKHEEAQKLLQEVQNMKATNSVEVNPTKPQVERISARKHFPGISKRNKEDDTDLYLAKNIMQNKQYSMSGRADDEYDYEHARRTNQRKRESNDDKLSAKDIRPRHMATQEERCIFCFENPNRPKHLTVSIANYTYLMLPQWQPVVSGHCCILPISHESASRGVDKTVWEEIRNFKKCLIMMFAKQDKDVVFLETVVGLAKQRRHCMIECIPLPQGIAKEAPLYFKKAIDEVEEEWSQHNAKKLIDTSEKGLRGSIPENFPYFHVEFGLNKGFVHVIDDENNFKTGFGLNVIRGMLQLAEEDMHRRRRYESVEVQKHAMTNFLKDWEPYDWTKQL